MGPPAVAAAGLVHVQDRLALTRSRSSACGAAKARDAFAIAFANLATWSRRWSKLTKSVPMTAIVQVAAQVGSEIPRTVAQSGLFPRIKSFISNDTIFFTLASDNIKNNVRAPTAAFMVFPWQTMKENALKTSRPTLVNAIIGLYLRRPYFPAKPFGGFPSRVFGRCFARLAGFSWFPHRRRHFSHSCRADPSRRP